MFKTAVAVFVKTPGHSPVKTRLAKTIGTDGAEATYKSFVSIIENKMIQIKESALGIEPYWAVAEPDCMNAHVWEKLNIISQKAGGLGERMFNVYDELLSKHDAVVLIGSDMPHIEVSLINQVHEDLKSKINKNETDFIIGPTFDGGFYLFAGTQKVPLEKWESVVYSDDSTCKNFINSLSSISKFDQLEENFDVDNVEDLNRLNELHPEILN